MKLNFCPECTAPLTKLDDTNYLCSNGHKYHNNPHTTCSVVFVNDQQQVLCTQRGGEPFKGKFDLPSGFLNFGEDAYQAAQREMKEELGIDVTREDLQIIDSAQHIYLENDSVVATIFLCRKWTGEMRADDDVMSFAWQPLDYIASDAFAWPYPNLLSKLQHLI